MRETSPLWNPPIGQTFIRTFVISICMGNGNVWVFHYEIRHFYKFLHKIVIRIKKDRGRWNLDKNKEMRMDEYNRLLLEQREKETRKKDIINQINLTKGEGLTSPTTSTSTEDTRLFMEYTDRANLLNISKSKPEIGKVLALRKFFKTKRNQQVEIYSTCGDKPNYLEGKVSAVGRDFVMITNLKERLWIPYSVIDSANIPFGVPNYSNSHQHYIFDNNLRKNLVSNFGATVSKKDTLRQQFYEETLYTNLSTWKGTWVEVIHGSNKKAIGKIVNAEKTDLLVRSYRNEEVILLSDIHLIKTIRFWSLMTFTLRKFTRI